MGKRTLFVAVIIMLSFGLPAAYGLDDGIEKVDASRKTPPQAAASKAQTPVKEVTKEEMLSELREDLADNDELFDAVPGLKASAGQNGNAVYTYKDIVLDELSKEDLTKLYSRVNQALVKIRTDRIQRQLETIRQVERFQRPANPPQPPRIPVAPPSAPRTLQSPPPAPQRR